MFAYIEKKQYLCSVIIKELVTTQSTVITEFFFLIDVKKPLMVAAIKGGGKLKPLTVV